MSNKNEIDTPAAPQAEKTPAKKTTRKSAAKKTTAKKAAVKKTAKPAETADEPKAPRKRTTKKAEPAATESTEPATSEPKARKAATKEVAPKQDPTPQAAQTAATTAHDNSPDADNPQKFGRVPGGGRVAANAGSDDAPPNEAPPQAAPPNNPPHGSGENNQTNQDQNKGQNRRRRDKRKRRDRDRGPHDRDRGPRDRDRDRDRGPRDNNSDEQRGNLALVGPKIEADGLLEVAPKGFGFLRIPGKNYEQARDDVFVSPELMRTHGLRVGQWIHGLYQESQRGPQLVEITSINKLAPEEAGKLPHFEELKAINPSKRLSFETTPERFTTRVVDIMAPVGRGQRGLIVSPPRSGKTTLLLHMAEAVREKYDENIHLMVLLVDERPEEVTEFRRALPGAEIYASSNDEQARNHCRIAELAIERAKRLVEAGKDVFLLMDSITRLARAYNNSMGGKRGRGTGSGGITIGALEVPRRLFAAARNTRGGGSLTILATALIQTNSRADEAIFMEFKGTGNMELVLDRKIAENYIYPAVDIFKSGTRREELLLAEHMLHKIHLIRRGLAGHKPAEAMERLLFFLKKFPNNPQMLLEIKG